jgi:hypothetical protein
VSKRPTDPDDWSSESEALFRSVKSVAGPSAERRERVREALIHRLADASQAPITAADSSLSAAKTSSVALPALVKIGFGVVVVIAAVFAFLRIRDSWTSRDPQPAAQANEVAARPRQEAATETTQQDSKPSVTTGAAAGAEASPAEGDQLRTRPASLASAPESSASAPRPRDGASLRSYAVQSSRHDAQHPSASRSAEAARARVLRERSEPGAAQRGGDASESSASDDRGTSRQIAPPPPGVETRERDPARSAATTQGSTSASRTQRQRTDERVLPLKAAPTSESESATRAAPTRDREASDRVVAAQETQQPAVATLDPSDPRAEIAFVRRIQAALRDANPRKALAMCAEHERRWPRGTFTQERDGLRAIASCRSDARDAPTRARDFFAAYPRGPLASQVRDACAMQLTAATTEATKP